MIRVRPEVSSLRPYVAGRTAAAVADDVGLGLGDIVKLASNEAPDGPMPEVVDAVAAVIAESNRYPDNAIRDLGPLVAERCGVEVANLWFGAGTSSILREVALAVGGPGSSAVFPDPSFVIYRLATQLAGATARPVPLDAHYRVDLGAVLSAIDASTTVVYLCTPNNPTGTINTADETRRFLDAVPQDVLVVVDEAYGEYVTDTRWETMFEEATTRPNVIVTRTFSKIYALAALRIGYAVGMAETLTELRKVQAPFTVTTVAQVAAAESMRHPEALVSRREANEAGRDTLESGLAQRGIEFVASQANFVYVPLNDPTAAFEGFQHRGVITRAMPGGLRVSVGLESELRRFFDVLDTLTLA